MMTIAERVEATLFGDCGRRDGNFLSVAAEVLGISQAEVDAELARETTEVKWGRHADKVGG